MFEFEVTTFINRPPQEVFDFTIDPANVLQWQNGAVSARWSSEGPAGVGSTIHSVNRFLGREVVMDAEITQWNPPNVWGQKAANGQLKLENTNKCESKDGGTLFVQSFKGAVGGFFRVAEGLAMKQIQKQIETDGNALKMLLEAR
jgi:uncharacterized protein YndB with AHSA1/START domain